MQMLVVERSVEFHEIPTGEGITWNEVLHLINSKVVSSSMIFDKVYGLWFWKFAALWRDCYWLEWLLGGCVEN